MLFLLAGLSGCAGSKVVYPGNGSTQIVRLRETVKGVNVWVKDSAGNEIPAKTDLLEGGYYRNNLNK